jgi:effector-binding domain-containing protein
MGQQNITQKNHSKTRKTYTETYSKNCFENSRSTIHKIFTWIEVKQNLTGK